MKLITATIKNFRSVSEVELSNCGDFNVLIGKNNSGKSNILMAIDVFFSCISNGSIISLETILGEEIDFFERRVTAPIEVIITFALSLSERDELIRDIASEAPQMRNAIDGIDTSLILTVELCIISNPKFAFVRKIAMQGETFSNSPSRSSERVILSLSDEAALELYGNLSRSQRSANSAELLSRIDMNAVGMYWEARTESRRVPINYLFRTVSSTDMPTELRRTIEAVVETANTQEELFRELRALSTKLQAEANDVSTFNLKNKIYTFSGEETAIPDYARRLVARVAEMKVLYLRERRKNIGKEEAGRLLELKVERGGDEALRNIKETVSGLLGVQIDAFRSKHQSIRGDMVAELDVDNFLVQVNGAGIRESLRLLLDYEFERPKILLVEEPEVHLHPALETSMMRYLKRVSLNCQVFITTHSTNFLDTADMNNVYLVSKTRATDVRLLNVPEAETQVPRELGIRLSSLFMFDRIVFVEGQSDEDIIREWASIVGINFSQANVGFIHMGGVRNFTHFAAEKVMSFLAKRQVKIWFIMDRDEKDDIEIARLHTMLGDKAIVKVLNKREIENYLVHIRAIVEFIGMKLHSQAMPLPHNCTLEEMRNVVNESADNLKLLAIEKRVAKLACEPVFPNRDRLFRDLQSGTIVERVSEEISCMVSHLEELRSKADSILKEQTEVVERQWETVKLSLVPGDLLLDAVMRRFNLRFIKERDGSLLASLMRGDEIDQEIRDIIREIGC